MADNVAVSEGTGTTVPVAADEIAGIKHQRVKLQFGADGSATDVSGASPLPVMVAFRQVSSSVTRPANTTAYAAGDAVTNSTTVPVAMTFADVVTSNGGCGRVVGARAILASSGTSTPWYELWLFAASAAPTADNDNAVFTPTDAECLTCIGIIDFATGYKGDATSGAGGNTVFPTSPLDLRFACDAGNNDLFGLCVIRNAYTPISADVLTFQLQIEPLTAS